MSLAGRGRVLRDFGRDDARAISAPPSLAFLISSPCSGPMSGLAMAAASLRLWSFRSTISSCLERMFDRAPRASKCARCHELAMRASMKCMSEWCDAPWRDNWYRGREAVVAITPWRNDDFGGHPSGNPDDYSRDPDPVGEGYVFKGEGSRVARS